MTRALRNEVSSASLSRGCNMNLIAGFARKTSKTAPSRTEVHSRISDISGASPWHFLVLEGSYPPTDLVSHRASRSSIEAP